MEDECRYKYISVLLLQGVQKMLQEKYPDVEWHLSQWSGHGVDNVAEHLLKSSQPVGYFPQSSISNGALHMVTGSWNNIGDFGVLLEQYFSIYGFEMKSKHDFYQPWPHLMIITSGNFVKLWKLWPISVIMFMTSDSPSDLPILDDLVIASISMDWLNCSATV